MRLSELEKGDRGTILRVDAKKSLKHRLYSFGIYKGAKFEVRAYSLGKKTIELQVGNSMVALRIDEADMIDIEKG